MTNGNAPDADNGGNDEGDNDGGNPPNQPNGSREWHAFLIAAAVISAFIVFLGYSLTSSLYDNSLDDRITLMKEVASILGGYVAAVLVYYFGQRQIQNLTGTLTTAQDNARTAHQEAETARHEEARIRNQYVPVAENAIGEIVADREETDLIMNALRRLGEENTNLKNENSGMKSELEELKKRQGGQG